MTRMTVFVVFLLVVAVASLCSAERLNDRWVVSFSERSRLVTWDNAMTLEDSVQGTRAFTRHRTQLGAEFTPTPVATIGARLANEFRHYSAPIDMEFTLDEVFVDLLYVRITDPGEIPVAFTIGRQNIRLGEGFVVADGTPLDGSRSLYFNAVRCDWRPRPGHTVTGFVSRQERSDEHLAIINDRERTLVEQAETGAGVYYAYAWSKNEVAGYLIRIHRSANGTLPDAMTSNMIGGRVAYRFPGRVNVTGTAEFAYQNGSNGRYDHGAYGGYGRVVYKPEYASPHFFLPTEFRAGVVYLSGDDPSTPDKEGWDPVFGRWPRWSESYIYTLVGERAVAWWSNFISLSAGIDFSLSPQVALKCDYHRLTAPEELPSTALYDSGGGTTRGDLATARLTYSVDKRWSGHLVWESFNPGDYYSPSSDSFNWIRAEVMFQY